MSVFADTSALYAALVRSEERHEQCSTMLESLLKGGRLIQTTNYVVLETTALLQHGIGLAPVRDFVSRILPLMNVCWVSGALHDRGVRRLFKEDQRALSLTDYVSFEYMAQEGLRDAFSLDRHFAEAGFRLL